jgi:segregation and condensation protein B
LLATTKEFLDYFNLKSLDQLPTLAELKDVEAVGVQLEFNTDTPVEATNDAAAEAVAQSSNEAETAESDAASPETEEAGSTEPEATAETEVAS